MSEDAKIDGTFLKGNKILHLFLFYALFIRFTVYEIMMFVEV